MISRVFFVFLSNNICPTNLSVLRYRVVALNLPEKEIQIDHFAILSLWLRDMWMITSRNIYQMSARYRKSVHDLFYIMILKQNNQPSHHSYLDITDF